MKGHVGRRSIPLGYASLNKKLVVVPEETETVRLIFSCNLELASIGNRAAGPGIFQRISRAGGINEDAELLDMNYL